MLKQKITDKEREVKSFEETQQDNLKTIKSLDNQISALDKEIDSSLTVKTEL